jgi:hypothetical protein
VIARLDGHLLLHLAYAVELVELLDLFGEVPRYGGDDLQADIADRYHPRMHAHLIEAIDTDTEGTGQLRRATTTHKGPTR